MPRGVEGACRIRNSSGERPRTTVARRPADVNPLLLARKISSTHEAFQLRGREQSYQQVCELRGEQRLWKDFAITRKYPHLLLVCVPRPLTEISKGCRRARSRGGHLKNDARGITDVADCHDQYQYGPRSLQLTRVKFLLLKSRANLLATHGKPTLRRHRPRHGDEAVQGVRQGDGGLHRQLPGQHTRQPSLCLQVTHWHSPRFHAYFPTANSYPAIVADMLSGAIACIGFSWIASPACTELEVVMLDWLGKMLELPPEFLASSGGKGGGVIQGTASEATLVALLGAKARVLRKARQENPDVNENDIVSKLVGYASSALVGERAGCWAPSRLRLLPTDANNRLPRRRPARRHPQRPPEGLIPFYAVATLGTTSSCAFDPLEELGVVCNQEGVWLHVDAAYAGSAFICPEYRYLMAGIEHADSFNFNPHKWMLVNFDCSAMWLKDPNDVVSAFNVDPLYLKHDQQGSAPDYRHWQIPLGRRFRALKLWFVFRLYGIANLQAHIRRQIALAHEFEDHVKSDSRFEIYGEVTMGLVCFRLKGSNELNETLLRRINGHGVIHLVPSKIRDTYFLRLAICSRFTESHDIKLSWNEVRSLADEVLAEERPGPCLPNVKPGYLRELLPESAPEQPEKWQDVMADVERLIMPGITHWHSPRFHAYYPTANSYPAIVADMLSAGIACKGFAWIASPACTELEVVMLDWLGKMLDLPPEFLAISGGKGGGVIQGTASESTLVTLLGAKARVVSKAREENPDVNESDIVSRLVGYASSQAHSSVERAGLLGGVKLRLLPTDANNRLRADALQDAIRSDRQQGLIPFYAVATLGTTSSCVFDPLEELGVVCNQEGVWLHVDAAYAGQLKDHEDFANFFNVDPLYLKSDRRGSYPDFRHWQIPLGRRFRALKLWFVFRLYGIANLQAHIRRHIALAHEFEDYVKSDSRFEIYGEVIMGLVCFRLKGSNELNEILLRRINSHGVIHLVPSKIHDTYFLRLVVCSRLTESHDIKQSWNEVRSLADEVLAEERPDN
ncbi:uncharacterized protein GBIM_07469 [Gryllus bimaculatus]|nr:uncharacterized protein GBIM_07469 [Gryllus bimaculatus]